MQVAETTGHWNQASKMSEFDQDNAEIIDDNETENIEKY